MSLLYLKSARNFDRPLLYRHGQALTCCLSARMHSPLVEITCTNRTTTLFTPGQSEAVVFDHLTTKISTCCLSRVGGIILPSTAWLLLELKDIGYSVGFDLHSFRR